MTDTKTDATSCVHEGVHYTLNNLEPGSGAWVMRERGLKRYRESVGQTFGVTTIEKILGYDVDDKAPQKTCYVLCRCVCGKHHVVRIRNLYSGSTKSCGCYKATLLQRNRAASRAKCREESDKELLASGSIQPTSRRAKDTHEPEILITGLGIGLSKQRIDAYWLKLDKTQLCQAWQVPEKFYLWAIRSGFTKDKALYRRDDQKPHGPLNSYWQ